MGRREREKYISGGMPTKGAAVCTTLLRYYCIRQASYAPYRQDVLGVFDQVLLSQRVLCVARLECGEIGGEGEALLPGAKSEIGARSSCTGP